MCVGFNFALLEVKIFMCKLVYRYHWEKEGDIKTDYDPFFQLIRPVNMYVKTHWNLAEQEWRTACMMHARRIVQGLRS